MKEEIIKSLDEVLNWKNKVWEELKNIPKDKQADYIKEKTQPVINFILQRRKKLK